MNETRDELVGRADAIENAVHSMEYVLEAYMQLEKPVSRELIEAQARHTAKRIVNEAIAARDAEIREVIMSGDIHALIERDIRDATERIINRLLADRREPAAAGDDLDALLDSVWGDSGPVEINDLVWSDAGNQWSVWIKSCYTFRHVDADHPLYHVEHGTGPTRKAAVLDAVAKAKAKEATS